MLDDFFGMLGLILYLFHQLVILQHGQPGIGGHLVASHAEQIGFELFGLLVHLFAYEVDGLQFLSVFVGDVTHLLLLGGQELLVEGLVEGQVLESLVDGGLVLVDQLLVASDLVLVVFFQVLIFLLSSKPILVDFPLELLYLIVETAVLDLYLVLFLGKYENTIVFGLVECLQLVNLQRQFVLLLLSDEILGYLYLLCNCCPLGQVFYCDLQLEVLFYQFLELVFELHDLLGFLVLVSRL